MPTRLLHEAICTSESRALLSSDAEVLMDRLVTKADDFGRYDARPAVILGACFPLQLDYWTRERVARCLDELEAVDTIRRWTDPSGCYLMFPSWPRWQRVRAKASRWPEPPADVVSRQQPPTFAASREHPRTSAARATNSHSHSNQRSRSSLPTRASAASRAR